MLVTGQVHGGVAQGIGQALYEGVAYSEEGQLLTASYQDYCVPRADDIPPIEVTLDDSAPCKTNPLGAKGCGKSGAIGGPPCITNGVMDALSELGIKQLNTPLTPAKVWQAIRDARAGSGGVATTSILQLQVSVRRCACGEENQCDDIGHKDPRQQGIVAAGRPDQPHDYDDDADEARR